MIVEKHLIAYFDILGYTNFMTNVQEHQDAAGVLELLNTINKLVQDTVKYDNPDFSEQCDAIEDKLAWLVFSDTIVVSVPYYTLKRSNPDITPYIWHYFLSICCDIQFSLFMRGLPSRGCIHIGPYLSSKHCFAGQALVHAYQESRMIQMSGVVVTKEAYDTMHLLDHVSDPMKERLASFLVRYLIPLADGKEKAEFILNWLVSDTRREQAFSRRSLRSLVLRKFWEHGKDIGRAVDQKVDNTIKCMEYLKFCTEGPPSA